MSVRLSYIGIRFGFLKRGISVSLPHLSQTNLPSVSSRYISLFSFPQTGHFASYSIFFTLHLRLDFQTLIAYVDEFREVSVLVELPLALGFTPWTGGFAVFLYSNSIFNF